MSEIRSGHVPELLIVRSSSANAPRQTLPKLPELAIAVAIRLVPGTPVASEVDERRGRVVGDDPDRRGLGSDAGRRIGDRELDVLAGREDERRRRVRQHREVGRAHEALDAGDDEIRNADVGNLDRQVIRRSRADSPEGEAVLETDVDRRAGRLDEGKYASPEGRGPQIAVVERQVEHRRAGKVDVVEHAPVRAAVDGAQNAEVRSGVNGGGQHAAVERERVERQVERRRDVGPRRCGERGAEDVPAREAAEPAEHGVEGRRVVGIEGDARDEAARQIARDVLEREGGRARRSRPAPVRRQRRPDCCCWSARRERRWRPWGSGPCSARSTRRPCFARGSVCCST